MTRKATAKATPLTLTADGAPLHAACALAAKVCDAKAAMPILGTLRLERPEDAPSVCRPRT